MLRWRLKGFGANLTALIFALLVLLPSSAAALDISTYKILSTPFYDPTSDQCVTLSAESGSGPLLGPQFPDVANPQDLVARINNFVATTQPVSPFVGLGVNFVAAGQKYNVNPALIIALAFKESSLGINQPSGSFDAFGLTADGDIPGMPFKNGITYLPSWEESIPLETNYIYSSYLAPGSTYYSQTIADMMKHYTPPNPAGATKVTLDVMHKILDGIAESGGSAAAAPASFTAGGNSTAQCNATSGYSAGANGYDLTSMAHYYQCDSQWANQPYGPKYAGNSDFTICKTGCGITSMAMVVSTLTGNNKTPLQLANQYGNVYNVGGTDWSLWPAAANDYGLKYVPLGQDFDSAAALIRQGGLVIISVGTGYFTDESHLMVLRAVDSNGNFYLADPNGPNNPRNDENSPFTTEFLKNPSQGDMNAMFGFSKQ